MKSILSALFLLPFIAAAQDSPEWQWSISDGSTGTEVMNRSVVDKDGNSYTTGYYTDSTAIGDSLFTNILWTKSGFVSKYDSLGNFELAIQVGVPDPILEGSTLAYGIAVDDDENIYVCGYVTDKVWFDTVSIAPISSGNNAFVAKYNNVGAFEWVRLISSDGSSIGRSLISDNVGNVYMIGDFTGTADFGGVMETSAGQDDMYILKFNPSGDVIWHVYEGGTLDEWGTDITIDASNDIYVTGFFQGLTAFESTAINCSGSEDAFVAKYSSTGDLVWAKQIGGSYPDPDWSDRGKWIRMNGQNVIVSGHFRDTIVFGPDTTISSIDIGPDIFVACMLIDGTELWINRIDPELNDWDMPVNIDSCGIYGVGIVTDTVYVQDTLVDGQGYTTFYVVKFDLNGDLQWIKVNPYTNNGWIQPREIIPLGYSNSLYIAATLIGDSLGIGDSMHYVSGSFDLVTMKFIDTTDHCIQVPTTADLVDQSFLDEPIVYPNPTADKLNIKFSSDLPVEIKLIDINGRLVKNIPLIQMDSMNYVLDLETVPPGIFFIHISGQDGVFIAKIIRI